jgi:hypothetical protein
MIGQKVWKFIWRQHGNFPAQKLHHYAKTPLYINYREVLGRLAAYLRFAKSVLEALIQAQQALIDHGLPEPDDSFDLSCKPEIYLSTFFG